MLIFKELNICSLKGNVSNYSFGELSYVYGKNSCGKSDLSLLIDFILGRSDCKLDLVEGLENIDYIECLLENGGLQLFLKRTSQQFFYKKSNNSAYVETNRAGYLAEISNIANFIFLDDMKKYQLVFGEDLSFRAFTFLNFLGEKGLGDLSLVFTEAQDDRFYFRIREVMSYLFDTSDVLEEARKKALLEENKLRFKELEQAKSQYDFCLSIIKKYFGKLSLEYDSKNLMKNRQSFDLFLSSKRRTISNKDTGGNLAYLTKASFSLSESIKSVSFQKQQSALLANAKTENVSLLTYFENISKETSDGKEINQEIIKLVSQNLSDRSYIASLDYDSTLQELIERKRFVDAEISKINNGVQEVAINDIDSYAGIVQNAFETIQKMPEIDEITNLQKQIQELETSLSRNKGKFYNQDEIKAVNLRINDYYKQLAKISYVKADIEKIPGFQILFDPLRLTIKGVRLMEATEDNKNAKTITYCPGSLAKQTIWQICTYLGTISYFRSKGLRFPFFPLLIIDSASQPFDSSASYLPVFHFLRDSAKGLGIQLIDISSANPEDLGLSPTEYVNISSGLNPGHSES